MRPRKRITVRGASQSLHALTKAVKGPICLTGTGPAHGRAGAVAVRQRDGGDLGAMPLFQVIDRLKDEVATKS